MSFFNTLDLITFLCLWQHQNQRSLINTCILSILLKMLHDIFKLWKITDITQRYISLFLHNDLSLIKVLTVVNLLSKTDYYTSKQFAFFSLCNTLGDVTERHVVTIRKLYTAHFVLNIHTDIHHFVQDFRSMQSTSNRTYSFY